MLSLQFQTSIPLINQARMTTIHFVLSINATVKVKIPVKFGSKVSLFAQDYLL